MPRLTVGIRWRIVSLKIDAGWSLRRIASHFYVSVGAVRGVLRIYEKTGDVIDRSRSGRQRVTEEDDDNFLIEESQEHPFHSTSRLRQ